MLKRLFALSVVLLGFGAHLFAQEEAEQMIALEDAQASDTTLISATSLAESINPILARAAADVEAARGRAYQAGLYPNPVAQGGATQLAGNESQYYFGLSQEIVTKHKLQLNQSAATREVYQAELHFVQTRFALLTAVRQTFFLALASQRRVDVLTKLLDITRNSATAAERMRAAGETSKADTLLFEIELEKAEVALENAQAQLAAARRQLAAVIGVREMNIGRIVGNLRISLDEAMAQILIDGYVPYNAQVQVAEQEVERSRILLQRAQVEPFPNITVYGGYQNQLLGVRDMGLLNASIPIPVWNRNQGNIAAAHAHIHRATADVGQVQNQIARMMAEGIGRYKVADQQARRFEEKIVPKAREGVTIIQEAFANGQFDSFRLLQSQRGLVESNLGYIAALESRWMAAAELAGIAQLETFP
ncbi:TolC family protein [Schlesneria paludicola]|uniref:TolC family protein n=1 Tax=Schlesneria paludicola TaxID=360056 RepID=UPI00029AE372|nr:TolC family protein [Schlesneria paludicola]